jgi:hypothetical protein
MNTDTPSPKRKRGAPFGNKNALKHGFFATGGLPVPPGLHIHHDLYPQTVFDPLPDLDEQPEVDLDDPHALDQIAPQGLQPEIDLMRRVLQRLVELDDPQTFEESVALLRALGLATMALCRLVRTHYYMISIVPLADPLGALLKEIGEEFMNPDLTPPGEPPLLTPE